MQFKRVFTMLTALGAIGTALAGTAGAKQLLLEQGWYLSQGDVFFDTTTAPPASTCPDTGDQTCAYYVDESEEITERINNAKDM